MAIVGLRLKQELLGIPRLELENNEPKKSIATTRTFEKNYTNLEQLQERISTFAVSCAEKLRKQKSHCNSIMVFIHTNGHRKDFEQYSKNIIINLPYPTNSSIELSKLATIGLNKIFKPGYKYKKAGVIVLDITSESFKQISLFENSNERHINLMKTIDLINKTHGQHKIKLASQDFKKIWKMKQEKLSPCYTTILSEIIKVKC